LHVAATILLTAIEMLEDHPLLRIERSVRQPLPTPFEFANGNLKLDCNGIDRSTDKSEPR
jgi:hypothetical protein